MVRNRVLYGLTVLACFGFSMAYYSKITQILLFVVLLYPLLALIMAILQLIFAKAEFCADRIVIQKGLSFGLMIRAHNPFIIPAVPMELVCSLPDGDTGLFAEKRLFISLPAFSNAEISVKSLHRFRGGFTCEIRKIYIVDPLRIIRVSKKYECSIPIVFLPRRFELDGSIFQSAVEQSYAQKQLHSADKEDFSHVRDYRDGDILQMVHWKLTAKQDELMIKQYDSTNDLHAAVLCDYDQKSDAAGMARADMVIETAIAFVKTAFDRGIHSTVNIGDLSGKPPFIGDRGAFERFFDMISVMPTDLETEDIISMIDRLDKSGAAILIIITDKLTDELIERVKNAAQQVTVFYVYLNLSGKSIDADLANERFLFVNVMGTSEDALKTALAQSITGAG